MDAKVGLWFGFLLRQLNITLFFLSNGTSTTNLLYDLRCLRRTESCCPSNQSCGCILSFHVVIRRRTRCKFLEIFNHIVASTYNTHAKESRRTWLCVLWSAQKFGSHPREVENGRKYFNHLRAEAREVWDWTRWSGCTMEDIPKSKDCAIVDNKRLPVSFGLKPSSSWSVSQPREFVPACSGC